MLAYVLAAGELGDVARVRALLPTRRPDVVVCADGGLRHAGRLGLTPDLIIGDFDSADAEQLAGFRRQGVGVQQVPAAKDETDSHLALDAALALGATEVMLLGMAGTRLDHTLSNLLLLTRLPTTVAAALVTEHSVVRLLGPGGRLELAGGAGGWLSLIPLAPAVTGIWVEGVRWPLTGETLAWHETRGVSNEIVAERCRIRLGSGWLAVIQAWD